MLEAIRAFHNPKTPDLNNLKEVVNKRFDFCGFPLRLEPAAGSPIRAVGIIDE